MEGNTILPISTQLYLLSLKNKYRIDIISFYPGDLIVQIKSWHKYEPIFEDIIYDLTKRLQICIIHRQNDKLYITYDEQAFNDESTINELLKLIERYQL